MSNVYYSKWYQIYFHEIFFDPFLRQHITRIAVLICNSVLVAYQSNESADVVQTASQSKLGMLVASKKSHRCRPPISGLHYA